MGIEQQATEYKQVKRFSDFKLKGPIKDPLYLSKEEKKALKEKLVVTQDIFSNIINKNKESLEHADINALAANKDLSNAWFSDLPKNVQQEMLAKLPLDVQEKVILNDFSFEHCKYLVEHYGENSLIAYHVSPNELKVGSKLEPSAKDPYLYFSTDIENLFKPATPRWLYAFKISLKEAEMGKYNDLFPEFGRLHGSYRIEDAIRINEDMFKKLGAKYSNYRAAGLKGMNEIESYDPDKNSELKY